jgi:hypothetical protein
VNELADIDSKNEDQVRKEWVRDMGNAVQRADLISKEELEEQCSTLLNAVVTG